MPLNERKIIEIILEECETVPKRALGYKKVIIDSLADIIQTERQHRVQGTNIQQKISDKCSAAGEFLAGKRGDSVQSDEI